MFSAVVTASCGRTSNLRQVKLFTPLSTAEAEQAERGMLRGDLVWVDNPKPGAATEDSVWVAIEVPDNRMARFERRLHPQLGYREFLLPSRITNLHRPQRVQLPL
jgi:hypothetical protein